MASFNIKIKFTSDGTDELTASRKAAETDVDFCRLKTAQIFTRSQRPMKTLHFLFPPRSKILKTRLLPTEII